MNPILLKSLLGISLTGGASAVAYGSYGLFTDKTIKDKLVEEKLDPLDVSKPEEATQEDISGDWGKLVGKLQTSQEPKIIQLSSTSDSNNDKKENIKALKKKCKELFEEKYSDNKNYQNAKSWCTKEKNS